MRTVEKMDDIQVCKSCEHVIEHGWDHYYGCKYKRDKYEIGKFPQA